MINNWQTALAQRQQAGALRSLSDKDGHFADFVSNDYLGLARADATLPILPDGRGRLNGSTGSRLLAGSSALADAVEQEAAAFFDAPAALAFSSGYMANLGVLSAIATRHDTYYFDHLCHASLKDGMRLSPAAKVSFPHNDVEALAKLLQAHSSGQAVVVAESLYSMDGDYAPLKELVAVCKEHGAQLVVDEAHSTGINGEHGQGYAHQLRLHGDCLLRIATFGKAMGGMGAVVLGPAVLRDYLINFSRPFIYSTAPQPQLYNTMLWAMRAMQHSPQVQQARLCLEANSQYFNDQFAAAQLPFTLVAKDSPIKAVVVGNAAVARQLAEEITAQQLWVKAVLSPTVPAGTERLRIIIHAYNTFEQVDKLIGLMKLFAKV